MNPAEYERMHALESHYWWFVGRRALIAQLLSLTLPNLKSSSSLRLVDIGCGTGANLPMLCETVGESGTVFGFDFSPLALEFARSRLHDSRIHLSQGDALRLPIRDSSTDLVTMLDVLEHLSDDQAALTEVRRILRPGGALVLSVPAYQHLWSAHDEALHHFRRYEKLGLEATLKQAGFKIAKLSFAMSMMPPVAWLWRKMVLPLVPKRPHDAKRHSEGAVLPTVPEWGNQLLVRYLQYEGQIIARRPIKFGTSLVAIAYKPTES